MTALLAYGYIGVDLALPVLNRDWTFDLICYSYKQTGSVQVMAIGKFNDAIVIFSVRRSLEQRKVVGNCGPTLDTRAQWLTEYFAS